MRVSIRVLGFDTPAARDDDFDLPDGIKVDGAIKEYLKRYNIGVGFGELSKSQFLVDGKACPLKGDLSEGCKLTIIRLLGGG